MNTNRTIYYLKTKEELILNHNEENKYIIKQISDNKKSELEDESLEKFNQKDIIIEERNEYTNLQQIV